MCPFGGKGGGRKIHGSASMDLPYNPADESCQTHTRQVTKSVRSWRVFARMPAGQVAHPFLWFWQTGHTCLGGAIFCDGRLRGEYRQKHQWTSFFQGRRSNYVPSSPKVGPSPASFIILDCSRTGKLARLLLLLWQAKSLDTFRRS